MAEKMYHWINTEEETEVREFRKEDEKEMF